jgi:hypothetical protein
MMKSSVIACPPKVGEGHTNYNIILSCYPEVIIFKRSLKKLWLFYFVLLKRVDSEKAFEVQKEIDTEFSLFLCEYFAVKKSATR